MEWDLNMSRWFRRPPKQLVKRAYFANTFHLTNEMRRLDLLENVITGFH